MALKQDKAFPAILCFPYATFIRPRGEAMLNKPKIGRLPWANIIDMSDTEFAAHYGMQMRELEELQNEIERSSEFDSFNKDAMQQMADSPLLNTTPN